MTGISKAKPLNLDGIQFQVLLGSILGDGNLYIGKGKNAVYREEHSLKQIQYAKWKNKILNFKETIVNRKEKRFGNIKEYQQICIYSTASPTLTELFNKIYLNNKKSVTKEILDKLEPLGIAVWYCDDGNYNYGRKKISIATLGFTKQENELIKEWLSENFGIMSTIRELKSKFTRGRFFIEISNNNKEKFIALIKPYVHESMSYKLGLDTIREENAQKVTQIYEMERKKSIKRIAYIKEHNKKYYEKNSEKLKKYQKNIARPRLRYGVCIDCGKKGLWYTSKRCIRCNAMYVSPFVKNHFNPKHQSRNSAIITKGEMNDAENWESSNAKM